MPSIAQEPVYVGIDVSKDRLDAHARSSGATRCLPHDAAGLKTLLRWLLALARVGLEAGPLAQWLFDGLAAAGLPAVLIETRHCQA